MGRCAEEIQVFLDGTKPNGGKHKVDDHAHFTEFYFALGKGGQRLGTKGQISLGQLRSGDIEPLKVVLQNALTQIPA